MFRIKIACRCLKLSFTILSYTRELSFRFSFFMLGRGKHKMSPKFKIKKCTRMGQINSIFPCILVKENKDR